MLLEGFFWDASQLHCYIPLNGFHIFKMGLFYDPLELEEKKKVTWNKFRWIGWLLQKVLDAHYIQPHYFFDMLKSWWYSYRHSSFSCPADFWSLEQSTNDCHTPPALPTQHWLQSCLLKASYSWNDLSPSCNTLWTSCATQKHVHNMVFISIHLLKYFKCLWWSFPQLDNNFWFIYSSVLIVEWFEKEKE